MQPTISIIVPVYNAEHYLIECVDSLLTQFFKNIEVILVDDGSPDSCPKICDEYAKIDSRVKVIHKVNGGAADARNEGLLIANGDYVLFVDSDDFIAKNSLHIIIDTLSEVDEVDVIFLEGINYFKERNKEVPFGVGIKKDRILNKDKAEVLNYLASLPKYPGSACTILIKRKLIIDNDLYFMKGITNEDVEWVLRLIIKSEKFNYCGSTYYYYRQERVDSVTSTFSVQKFKCLFDVIKKWSKIEENDEAYLFRSEIYSFMAYEYNILLSFYPKLDKNNKNKYGKELKSYSWLMNFRSDMKNKVVRRVYKVFGLNITTNLLNLYLNRRKKYC